MDFGRAIKPTISELLSQVTISFLFIGFAQYQNIFLLFTGEDVSREDLRQLLSEAFASRLDSFFELIEANDLTASIILSLFWAGIGVAVYFIVNSMQKLIAEAGEDLVMEARYVHPRSYKHRYFWYQFASRILFRTAVIVGIGLYSLMMVQLILPLWIQLIEGWLLEPWAVLRIANAFLAFVGMVLSFHVLVVLFRFLLLRERIFDTA